MRSHAGTIRLALCFALLLCALTLVIWRQSAALATLRELDRVRDARALAEAERSDLLRDIEHLESRAVVVAAARDRLGMRVPFAHEIVILPLQREAAPHSPSSSRASIALSMERP
jgi:cell division protein FtsL